MILLSVYREKSQPAGGRLESISESHRGYSSVPVCRSWPPAMRVPVSPADSLDAQVLLARGDKRPNINHSLVTGPGKRKAL